MKILMLITIVILIMGCDNKYIDLSLNDKNELKDKYTNIMKRLPIVCNEFGVAYYINSSGQHTSYVPVFKNSTDVAMCSDLNLK